MITYEMAIEKLIKEGKIESKVGMEFLGKTEAPKEPAPRPQQPQQNAASAAMGAFANKFKKTS